MVLASAFFAALLLSCNKESRWDCFKGTGESASETRSLAAFDKIYLEGNVDVFIKQGSTYEAKIEAGENLIPLIKTKVENNTLYIDNNNKCNWARSYKKGTINVYLTLPDLRNIWHYGSGSAQSTDTITCDTLTIWAHQTGDVELTVNAAVMYTNMHTTANITLHGTSGILGSWHAGEGYLHCEDLKTSIAWIHSIASGNGYVNVLSDFAATIDWEGDIFYTGNPIVTRKGKGTGKLIQQN